MAGLKIPQDVRTVYTVLVMYNQGKIDEQETLTALVSAFGEKYTHKLIEITDNYFAKQIDFAECLVQLIEL